VVNLPNSLMIVHSNAFVCSTSLLEVVFRYGLYNYIYVIITIYMLYIYYIGYINSYNLVIIVFS